MSPIKPRFLIGLFSLVVLGGTLLSCQQDRPTQPVASGPFVVSQTWPMDSIRMPDSVSWVHKGTSGTFHLTRFPKDSFRVTDSFPQSIASDTLTMNLWRLGLRTTSAVTVVQASGTLQIVPGKREVDSLAVEFLLAFDSLRTLDRATFGSPSDPVRSQILSLQNATAALVLAGRKSIDSLARGLDSLAVVRQILVQGAHAGSNIAAVAKATGLDTASLKVMAQSLLQNGDLKAADSTALFPPYPVRVKTALSVSSPVVAGGPAVSVQGLFAWTKGTRINNPKYAVHTSKGSDPSFDFLVKSLPQASDTTWNLSGNFSLQAPAAALPGTDTLIVTLSDDSGRVATAWATFKVVARDTTTPIPPDSVPPSIKPSSSTKDTAVAWTTFTYRLSWSVTDDSALGAVTLNDSLLVGKDGQFETTVSLKVGTDSFVLVAKDKHGRESRSKVLLTRLTDTTRPLISFVAPAKDLAVANDVQNIEVEVTASDTSGIDSVKIGGRKITTSPYKTTLPLAIGPNVVEATAWDKAGNPSATISVTITRANSLGDTIAPRIQRTAPTAKDTTVDYLVASATLSYLVTDDSLLASVTLGGKPIEGTANLYRTAVDLPVGSSEFVLLALDKHGNPARDTVKITRRKDSTKPVIKLVSPSRDTDVSYKTTEFVVSVAVTDIAGIDSVFIGGTPSASATSPYVAKVPLQVGANALTIEAVDKFGNRSTAPLVITRAWATDSVPPTITRIAPTNDTTEVSATTTSYNLSWKVADDSTVASVTLNGKAITGTAGTYTSTQPLVDGINTFAFEAKDARGNTRGDAVHLVRLVDPTKPVVAWQGGSKDTSVWAFVPGVAATWKVTDNALKLVTINGAAANKSGDLYSQSVDLATDVTWIRLMALDSSGNTTLDSVKVTRKYDKTPPTAVFQKTKYRLVANAVTTDTLVWTVSDDLKLKSVKINDSSFAVSGDTYTLKVNLAVGTHRYALVATDSAGNQTFDTATVARTALAPTHSAPAGRYIGTVYDTLKSPGADSILYSTDGTTWKRANGSVTLTSSGTVYAKAIPGEQLSTVKYELSRVRTVAPRGSIWVSSAYTIFVMEDGSVWGAGSASGVYSGAYRDQIFDSAIKLPNTALDVVVGNYQAFYLQPTKLWSAAGQNDSGMLGNEYPSDLSPLSTIALTGVEQIAVSNSATYFRRSDGSLWGAGQTVGDLGGKAAPTNGVPVQIHGLSHLADVATGSLRDEVTYSVAAVDSAGKLYVWGYERPTPTEVLTGVRAISFENTLTALMMDGTVQCVGDNSNGQIGNGTTHETGFQFSQTLGLANIKAIATGNFHNLFLKSDGSLYVAGMVPDSILFYMRYTGPVHLSPVLFDTNVDAVWCAGDISFYRKKDGTLWAMGSGYFGEGSEISATPKRVNF